MIKNCDVLINNNIVTVFDFDGVHVQVPAINRKAATVKVLFENGIYKVVDDDFKIDKIRKTFKEVNKTKKETTDDETVKKENVEKIED